MDKVHFAVIGHGNIGSRHVAFLKDIPKARVIWVCDVKEERARDGADKAGGECGWTTDLNEILGDPEVDVVDICTPSGLHAEMSVRALDAGKHAISEKPMALSLKDADRVLEAEKNSPGHFFLVKQNRYNPPVEALMKAIHNGSMGKLYMIVSDVFWNRRKGYFDEEEWRGTLSLDGGALFTQSSHFIDLILWIGGVPVDVEATMSNIRHPYIEVEDLGTIRIRFQNGTVAVMNYTTAIFEKNLEGSISVLGTTGSVKIGGKYLNELTHWNVQGIKEPNLPPGRPPNTYKGGYQGSMSNHDKVFENVIDVLTEGKKKKVSSMAARLTVEVMQAAHISALEGRSVRLPLTGDDLSFDLKKTRPFPER